MNGQALLENWCRYWRAITCVHSTAEAPIRPYGGLSTAVPATRDTARVLNLSTTPTSRGNAFPVCILGFEPSDPVFY